MFDKIERMLQKHLAEAENNSITDTAPSALKRGEGTLRDYFILKVDLCGSTQFLLRKQQPTYLRLAHTFLSTIDHITRQFGAESNQVEYAGDGIIAYFPCDTVTADDVLRAAYYCRYAAGQMKGRHATFRGYEFNTKIMLHKAELILTKIGPWGGSRITAIGYGLHQTCKMEKDVPPNEGRASLKFGEALSKRYWRFLTGEYHEEVVPVTLPQRNVCKPSGFEPCLRGGLAGFSSTNTILAGPLPEPAPISSGINSLAAFPSPNASGLSAIQRRSLITNAFYGDSSSVATPALAQEVKKTLVRHKVVWGAIEAYEQGRLRL